MIKQILVNCCDECPYFKWGINLYCEKKERIFTSQEDKMLSFNEIDIVDWCPLEEVE